MNGLDLNAYGVMEMDGNQTREVNGGLILEAIAIGIAIFALGYQMGSDRAAQDR